MLEERESNLVMNFNFVTLHLGIYKLVPTISQQKLNEKGQKGPLMCTNRMLECLL